MCLVRTFTLQHTQQMSEFSRLFSFQSHVFTSNSPVKYHLSNKQMHDIYLFTSKVSRLLIIIRLQTNLITNTFILVRKVSTYIHVLFIYFLSIIKHSYKFPSYFRKQSLLSAKPKFNTKNFVLPIKLKKVSLFTHNQREQLSKNIGRDLVQ